MALRLGVNSKPATKLSRRPPPRGELVKSLKALSKSPDVVLLDGSGLLDESFLSKTSNGSGLSGLSVMMGSVVSVLGTRSAFGMTDGMTLGTSEVSLGADGVLGEDGGGEPKGEAGGVPGVAGFSSSRAGAGRTVSQ